MYRSLRFSFDLGQCPTGCPESRDVGSGIDMWQIPKAPLNWKRRKGPNTGGGASHGPIWQNCVFKPSFERLLTLNLVG